MRCRLQLTQWRCTIDGQIQIHRHPMHRRWRLMCHKIFISKIYLQKKRKSDIHKAKYVAEREFLCEFFATRTTDFEQLFGDARLPVSDQRVDQRPHPVVLRFENLDQLIHLFLRMRLNISIISERVVREKKLISRD